MKDMNETPCDLCGKVPSYPATWRLRGGGVEEHRLCVGCDEREAERLAATGVGIRVPTEVDFAVEGLDDRGGSSGRFLQVSEAALVEKSGREVGRFTDADALLETLGNVQVPVRLVALATVGEPRLYIVARVVCDEQAPCPEPFTCGRSGRLRAGGQDSRWQPVDIGPPTLDAAPPAPGDPWHWQHLQA